MKPTSPSVIERRLARHDLRASSHRACWVADCLFRPQTDPNVRPIQPRVDDPSRRAFRRMSTDMLARLDRPKAVEMFVFALVTAITAWQLVSLLMLMAETAPG
jgi:hypothetical protein